MLEVLPTADSHLQGIAARRARQILYSINGDDTIWLDEKDIDHTKNS